MDNVSALMSLYARNLIISSKVSVILCVKWNTWSHDYGDISIGDTRVIGIWLILFILYENKSIAFSR